MARILMKGNEAIAEAAIQAGCRFFFGYPITPQNQIPEYMSRRLPQVGGCYIQSESELAAINMVYGAAGAGARCMTSSSSPGISLKQEGISYIAGAELPCLIVNMMRGGPGLGGIQPSQADYFQATRGGGNGDYRLIVLAPGSVQEAATLTGKAFDLADEYRMPVMMLGDGFLGQMMEPVEIPEGVDLKDLPAKPWAAQGWTPGCGRERAVINSLYLDPASLEKHNQHLQEKYDIISAKEASAVCEYTEDAEIILTAYGTMARIVKSAVQLARKEGIKAGLIRPVTLWPFPNAAFNKVLEGGNTKVILTVEMSMGQMVEDVRLAVEGRVPTPFYGRTGGMVPSTEDVLAEIRRLKEAL
nr:3-methyl-2-oxobutanoate dehydrogenase subunit VorB [bacterium]